MGWMEGKKANCHLKQLLKSLEGYLCSSLTAVSILLCSCTHVQQCKAHRTQFTNFPATKWHVINTTILTSKKYLWPRYLTHTYTLTIHTLTITYTSTSQTIVGHLLFNQSITYLINQSIKMFNFKNDRNCHLIKVIKSPKLRRKKDSTSLSAQGRFDKLREKTNLLYYEVTSLHNFSLKWFALFA